jgi:hypothetical protein
VQIRADDRPRPAQLPKPEGLLRLAAGGHAAAGVAWAPVAGHQPTGNDREGEQEDLAGRHTRIDRDVPGNMAQLAAGQPVSGLTVQEAGENVGDGLDAVRPDPAGAPQRRGDPESGEGGQRNRDDNAPDCEGGEFSAAADRLGISSPLGRCGHDRTVPGE